MKRVLVAGLHHESNSLSPIITRREDFSILRGQEIIDRIRDNDSLSGIVLGLKEAGYEVLPTLAVRAIPSGLVDRDFYLEVKKEIIEGAKRAQEEAPLDGICLSLHGSMMVEGYGEAEGPLLEELRKLFPQLPIYASLDMHTTMTRKMHKNCDGFVGYKSAPHEDCTETGRQAALLMHRRLEGSSLQSTWVYLPLLIAGEKSGTSVSPMKELIEKLRQVEEIPGVLAASYLMGFPWTDNKDSGVSVYLVSENSFKENEELARQLAELLWSKREEFDFVSPAYKPEEALEVAFESIKEGETPFYISDAGDNPTAGASSDNTYFLKLILEDRRRLDLKKPIIYGGIYDPLATRSCKGRLGEKIKLRLGGYFDKASPSIELEGQVKAYYEGWSRHSFPRGDLAVFSLEGVDLVLSEQHIGYTDPQIFRDLGLVPEEAELIICKLGYLTPAHEKLARGSLLALSQGNSQQNLEDIDYKLVRRPIFPLDRNFTFKARVEEKQ